MRRTPGKEKRMSEIRNINEGKRINAKKKREIDTDIDFEFGSSRLARVLLALLAVIIVVFCVYQVARMRSHQKMLHTQTAINRTVSRTISTDGFVLRAESVIPYRGSGAVVPVAANGSKVAIGDTVAKSYPSAEAAADSVAYAGLEEALRYYTEIASYSGNTVSVGMELYDQNIVTRLLQFENALEQSTLSELSSVSKALGAEITKKQIAVGKQVNVDEAAAALEEQMDALAPSLKGCTEISAVKAGFYMNETDGYESAGDYQNVLDIKPAGVRRLLNAAPAPTENDRVGKLITEFNWYLVCVLPETEAKELKIGRSVNVSFTESGGSLDMLVKSINSDENGDAAIVFVSDRMDAQLAQLRLEKIKICTETYSGYAVDRSAVRTVDGELGVYIQLGSVIRFRKIEVVYSDDTVILASNKEESGYLRLYDEIIVEGTDLSDGKIID